MSRPADPAVVAVVNNYKAAVRQTRMQAAAFAAAVWGQLTSYRDADMAAVSAQVVPFMQGAKQHTAALTDAYLAAVASHAIGDHVAPVGVPASSVDELALRGVTDEVVYGRPGVTIWTALSQGADIATAAGYGLNRLQAIVATDLQLAKTHSSRFAMNATPHVVGYLRVTDGHCCALCETASSRMYHRGDLLPIHAHCSCDVQPVFQTGEAARIPVSVGPDSGREDVGDTPIVHLHGELGPVLAVKGQLFTGPDDLQ